MVLVFQDILDLLKVQSFKVADLNSVVFQTPVRVFKRDDVVDLLEQLGDGKSFMGLILRDSPKKVGRGQLVPADGQAQPHVDATGGVEVVEERRQTATT